MRHTTTLWTILFSLLSPSLFAGDNWAEFRGPQGSGISQAKGLPTKWSETENIVWKTPIHGKGWSSPVVWGNQIWLTTATVDGKKMSAICLDAASGKIVHDLLLFENAEPRFCHPTNSYASPTPVIEEGRIYCHFGSYGTACLDTKSGKTLWTRRDLESDDFRGPGSSPILFEDLLVVNYDGVDLQFVVAFNKKTSDTVWQKKRNIEYGTDNGDRKKAYGTPTIVEFEGHTQLVSPSAVATIAYDPRTGDELWKLRHGGMNAAARPLFGHGLIYIAAGDDDYSLVALRPNGTGDVTDTHIAWKTSKSVPRRGSQLLVGDLYFMVNDTGILTCLDAKTGDIHWQKRRPGQFWSSPIYGDGKIYACDDQGVTLVLSATKEYSELAENKLSAGCNASPAVVDQSLLIRTKTHLYRIGK